MKRERLNSSWPVLPWCTSFFASLSIATVASTVCNQKEIQINYASGSPTTKEAGHLNISIDKVIRTDSKPIEVTSIHEDQTVGFRAPRIVIKLERQVSAKVVPRGLARSECLHV